jgi:3-dehydroquinate synthase
MAMVDSSVGGKTGVNHPLGKNMIGAFHQPQCVFIDTTVLDTLPDRELKSGLSEVVKYGLIRDAPFFEWQEANMDKLLQRDAEATRYAIKRSCENKAEVVAADEKEAGVRATLNLGHTFGHASKYSHYYIHSNTCYLISSSVENGSGYGTWLHGEGVSIGTAMAAKMSEKMGWIDSSLTKRIYDIFEKADLPVKLPKDSPMTIETFNKLMSLDKKVADGQLRLILLRGNLGNCEFTGDFDVDALQATIDEFVKEIAA